MPNTTPAPPAREALTDSRTNFVSRPWYMFFQSLYQNFLNYIGAQPPADGQLLRYDAAGQGWTNTVGVTVSATGEISTDENLLINNPDSYALGRGVVVDGRGFGSYLLLTNSDTSTVTQLYAQDSGVVLISQEIELASEGNVYLTAGGVRCSLLSGTNGFLSLSTGSIPTPTAQLDINNNTIRLRNSRTPASATASGNRGDICWDTNYIYVCVATNTWKRTAISTW